MEHEDTSHRKRRPRRGDMNSLANIVWRAILTAETILVSTEEPELQLRAINAIGQSAAHYSKICESLDLVKRIEELEQAVKRPRRSP